MNKKDFILIYQPIDGYDVDDGMSKQFLRDLDSYTDQIREEEYKKGYTEGFRIGNY